MLDIGFFEILVVAVVLIIVMGPERLPEVVRQAAFFIRKARQGVFRLRSEMHNEMQGTPFSDLQQAKQEINDFKNDIKQFGRDLADSAEQNVNNTDSADMVATNDTKDRAADKITQQADGEKKSTPPVDK